ncbi:MAG: 6-bladed beta-propeller [Prolixibacteraceae bacterium]|nr:6-bladed beta-propeller [Prolixibacteraceae bacterium]
MNLKYIIFISIFISLHSCKSEVTDIVSINAEIENAVNVLDITEYFHPEYIMLEKNEQCLIGEIHKAAIYSDYIIVLDKQISKGVYLFNRSGKFIRQIGSKGKGRGEYLYLEDFNVINDKIFLLSGLDRKLLVYDFDGNIIREERMSDHGGQIMGMFSDESYFTLRSNSRISVNYWKKNGELKNTIFEKEYSFINWQISKGYSQIKNASYISPKFTETIYFIDKKKIYPIYTFDYGKRNFPIGEVNNKIDLREKYKSKEYTSLYSFTISDDFLITRFVSFKPYYGVYFRKSGELILTKRLKCNDILLTTNIGEFEKGIIYSIESSMLVNLKNYKGSESVPLELHNVKSEDNPVLILLKQKEGAFNKNEE